MSKLSLDRVYVDTRLGTTKSKFGLEYAQAKIVMCVSRCSKVWLYEVYAPTFMITSLAFLAFALESSDNQDRMAIDAALLLAIVALKFTVSKH